MQKWSWLLDRTDRATFWRRFPYFYMSAFIRQRIMSTVTNKTLLLAMEVTEHFFQSGLNSSGICRICPFLNFLCKCMSHIIARKKVKWNQPVSNIWVVSRYYCIQQEDTCTLYRNNSNGVCTYSAIISTELLNETLVSYSNTIDSRNCSIKRI